jgi:hypothetical protein
MLNDALRGLATDREKNSWLVLDRLLQSLSHCHQLSQALPHAVEAILDATGADSAFVYNTATERATSTQGPAGVPEPDCKRFASHLVARVPAGRDDWLWVSSSADAGDALRPHSAILARLGKSPTWLVTLSLRPDRPLLPEQLGFVGLVRRAVLHQHHQTHNRLKNLLGGLVQSLSTALEAKDTYTAGHSERVARIGVIIAKQAGLSAAQCADVYLAGCLHDIGKIGIQDSVLQKVGPLNDEERSHIQEHPVIGDQIVSTIQPFKHLRPGVRNHHERWDGTGYPDGLAGEAIPLLARILAVADACDAMMSPRRYRAARTPPQIDAIVQKECGQQFDPRLVEAFMAIRHQVYPPIYQKGVGESAFHAIDQVIDALSENSLVGTPALHLPRRDEEG